MPRASQSIQRLALWVMTGVVGLAALAPILAGGRPLYESGAGAPFTDDAETFRDAFAVEWADSNIPTRAHIDTNLATILPCLRPADRAEIRRLRATLDAPDADAHAAATIAAIADRLDTARPLDIARSPVLAATSFVDGWWIGAFLGWVVASVVGRRRPSARWTLAVAARTGVPAALLRNGAASVGAGIACAIVVAGLGSAGAPLDVAISDDAAVRVHLPIPFDANALDLEARLSAPGSVGVDGRRHWLGTDESGHDVASRLVWGARRSLVIGGASVAVLLLIALVVGTLAGYARGADVVLSRIIEIVDAFPPLVLVLTVVALVGAGPVVLIAVIAGTGWTKPALLTRGEVARIRRAPFVEAARTMGMPLHRILFVHVLPNAAGPAIVHGVFAMATAILIEAGLSFLGLGAANAVSWGQVMLTGAETVSAWWLTVFPGAILFATILSLHVLAARLRSEQAAWEVA